MWHDHESLFRLIDQHLGWYPSMEPREVYKLLYQGVRGPEHIIGSEAAFREGLLAEFAPLEPASSSRGRARPTSPPRTRRRRRAGTWLLTSTRMAPSARFRARPASCA